MSPWPLPVEIKREKIPLASKRIKNYPGITKVVSDQNFASLLPFPTDLLFYFFKINLKNVVYFRRLQAEERIQKLCAEGQIEILLFKWSSAGKFRFWLPHIFLKLSFLGLTKTHTQKIISK